MSLFVIAMCIGVPLMMIISYGMSDLYLMSVYFYDTKTSSTRLLGGAGSPPKGHGKE